MSNSKRILEGTVHGNSIELEQEPDFPEGQNVRVEIQPAAELPTWTDRFVVDPGVAPAEFIVKGTRLLAEDLAGLIEEGRSDEELLGRFSELTMEDIAALRQYSKVPIGLRRSAGAWSDDLEGLEEFLEWNRRQRKLSRWSIPE
jgi:uncharacterized protein (DUF433 family)